MEGNEDVLVAEGSPTLRIEMLDGLRPEQVQAVQRYWGLDDADDYARRFAAPVAGIAIDLGLPPHEVPGAIRKWATAFTKCGDCQQLKVRVTGRSDYQLRLSQPDWCDECRRARAKALPVSAPESTFPLSKVRAAFFAGRAEKDSAVKAHILRYAWNRVLSHGLVGELDGQGPERFLCGILCALASEPAVLERILVDELRYQRTVDGMPDELRELFELVEQVMVATGRGPTNR